ncbi:Peptide chain release factor 1 [subsurface metagenome]
MAEEKSSFLTKLDELDARFCQLEKQIADPAIAGDPAKLIALSKEQGKLKTVITKYREYKKTTADIKETRKILEDSTTEQDFRTLAKEEIQQLEDKKNTLLDRCQFGHNGNTSRHRR